MASEKSKFYVDGAGVTRCGDCGEEAPIGYLHECPAESKTYRGVADALDRGEYIHPQRPGDEGLTSLQRLARITGADQPSPLLDDLVFKTVDDPVSHPSHYTAFPLEVIDVIKRALGPEGFKAYCFGSEIKYRMRAGLKGDDKAAEDIRKAMAYKKFREGAE